MITAGITLRVTRLTLAALRFMILLQDREGNDSESSKLHAYKVEPLSYKVVNKPCDYSYIYHKYVLPSKFRDLSYHQRSNTSYPCHINHRLCKKKKLNMPINQQ